ncbi:MAG: hypothetical protein AAGA99_12935 [Actinomycetota bacterium]
MEKLTAGRVFVGCTTSERRRLDRISTLMRFESGAVIAGGRSRGPVFGVIIEGSARLVEGGRVVARLSSGDHFGEAALLDRAGLGGGDDPLVVIDDDAWVALSSGPELSGVLAAVPWLVDRLIESAANRIASRAVIERTATDA